MSKKTYKANIAKLKSNPVGKASPDAVVELEDMAREVLASARVSKIGGAMLQCIPGGRCLGQMTAHQIELTNHDLALV